MPDSENVTPRGRSTGPTSPEGKQRSSLNSLDHGCCSKTLLLPGESPEEFEEFRDGWLADYQPNTPAARHLVLDAVQAHWFLIRNQSRLRAVEQALGPKDPFAWTPEDHQTFQRFSRYFTAAQRAFHRAFRDLEHLRSARFREQECLRRAEERAALLLLRRERLQLEQARFQQQADQKRARRPASPEPAPPPPEAPATAAAPPPKPSAALFDGRFAKKNLRKIPILDQWVEITRENGQTVTRLFPSNRDLIREGQAMDPPPELVYRRLNFVDGVPPEYHWATPSEHRRQMGGFCTQRMTVDTWLETIKREQASGSGHIGPTGADLARPRERGSCDCPTCTALSPPEPDPFPI